MKPYDLNVLGRSALLVAALLVHAPALAYIGPGAGLSAIGSVLALLGAVLLMVVGFVWYPAKRLMKRRKAAAQAADHTDSATGTTTAAAPTRSDTHSEPASTHTTEA